MLKIALLSGHLLLLAGCAASPPASICRLDDRAAAIVWASDIVKSRNDDRGNPEMRFVTGTLLFDSIDEYPEGYFVRFTAKAPDGSGRQLAFRMHRQSCTYEIVGGPEAAITPAKK